MYRLYRKGEAPPSTAMMASCTVVQVSMMSDLDCNCANNRPAWSTSKQTPSESASSKHHEASSKQHTLQLRKLYGMRPKKTPTEKGRTGMRRCGLATFMNQLGVKGKTRMKIMYTCAQHKWRARCVCEQQPEHHNKLRNSVSTVKESRCVSIATRNLASFSAAKWETWSSRMCVVS